MRTALLLAFLLSLPLVLAADPGDMNGDELVNVQDIILVVQHIGRDKPYTATADLNGDGSVNIYDLVQVTRRWGTDYTIYVPQMSGGQPSGTLPVGTTTADLTLTTNLPAECRYSAAPNATFTDMALFATTGNLTHSTPIATAAGSHAYYVKCHNPVQNKTARTDSVISFSVPADTQAPTQVTGLSATAASPSQINLAWNAASDNVGVGGYRVLRDGALRTTTAARTFNDTGLSAGTTYTYTVHAYDAAGNNGTPSTPSAATTVAIDTTAPQVSLTVPSNGATLSAAVTLNATATDNTGVVGVQFLLDGANLGAEDTSAPYSASWNTVTAPNGAHTLGARARDAAGNTNTTTVSVTVSNAAPPPGDEPVFDGDDVVMLSEDFESYATSAALISRYPDRQNSGTINVDFATFSEGTRSMRIDRIPPPSCIDGDVMIETNFVNVDQDVVVFQYMAAYDPDYVFLGGVTGSCGGASTHKEFIVPRSGGTSRITVNAASTQPANWVDENGVQHNVDAQLGVPVGAYGFDITIAGDPGGTTYKNTFKQHLARTTHTPDTLRGGFRRVTVRLTRESSYAAGDGKVEMWVAGTKVMDIDGASPTIIAADGSTVANPYYGHTYTKTHAWLMAQFPSVMNSGAPQEQSQWFDEVRVYSPR